MSALMHLLLHHRQQTRSYLVLGAGAQDACMITLLKSPWHVHPCLLFASAFHRGRSNELIRCSSSSVWRKPSVIPMIQTIEQDWEVYFADFSQWWDYRFYKVTQEQFWKEKQFAC